MRTKFVGSVYLLLLWGCSSNDGTVLPGNSTNPNTGGTTASTTASTTSNATGGISNASGGTVTATGGTVNASSTTSSNTGGKATGGTSSGVGGKATGGSNSGSGTTNTGGTVNTSGGTSTGVGGKTSTGGTTSTGGKASTGGTTSSTGGTTSTGGKASTGGTTSTGGTSTTGPVVVTQCGIPAAGATGKAKPSGTAGNLKVLDWAGFKSAISYTFDDANSSQIDNYTAMNATGGKFTFYLITSKTEASNAVYKTALKDGHEIGNHTSDHTNCPSAASTDAANTAIKSTFGVTAYAFAAPNGDAACKSVASKFLTDRSVAGGSIDAGNTSSFAWLPSDIATGSNLAPTAGKWRVICIHGFTGGKDGAYQPIDLTAFTSAAKAAVTGGSWVDTVTNVAAYQVGQKAIKAATGNKITWSLPSIFPTGKCVRVTVDGGTVKQNGTEVPWDDHGYYEISLDAKELSVE